MAYEKDRTPARTGPLHGRLEVALEGVALRFLQADDVGVGVDEFLHD